MKKIYFFAFLMLVILANGDFLFCSEEGNAFNNEEKVDESYIYLVDSDLKEQKPKLEAMRRNLIRARESRKIYLNSYYYDDVYNEDDWLKKMYIESMVNCEFEKYFLGDPKNCFIFFLNKTTTTKYTLPKNIRFMYKFLTILDLWDENTGIVSFEQTVIGGWEESKKLYNQRVLMLKNARFNAIMDNSIAIHNYVQKNLCIKDKDIIDSLIPFKRMNKRYRNWYGSLQEEQEVDPDECERFNNSLLFLLEKNIKEADLVYTDLNEYIEKNKKLFENNDNT